MELVLFAAMIDSIDYLLLFAREQTPQSPVTVGSLQHFNSVSKAATRFDASKFSGISFSPNTGIHFNVAIRMCTAIHLIQLDCLSMELLNPKC